jgi:transposase
VIITLQELLEVFAEAQSLGRKQGLTKADWRRYYRALRQKAYENVQSRKDNRLVVKQIIDAVRHNAGLETHSCSCGRHKTEKLCASAKQRSLKSRGVRLNPFPEDSDIEKTRMNCG